VATDKRERQRAARLEKTVAEASAAKRHRTRATVARIVAAGAIVVGVLFGVSWLMSDDDDDSAGEVATEDSAPEVTEPPAPEYTDPALAEEVLARTPPSPEPPPADTPADALEVGTVIEGEGPAAEAGDTVTVHYVGVLADGTEFDQSWARERTFDVTPLGEAPVIDGWNEGLVGAKIGERRRLVIGSDKAYGPDGNPPAIPAAAPLAFEIDVVDVQPGG
jgi:peptidylprolyl isomerase